ncbi:MAG: hypothetical protein WCK51_15540 [Armatimonadota bacterium]
MNTKTILANDSPQLHFARAIRDPDRRRFAHAYMDWLAAGRLGAVPEKGRLSAEAARMMVIQIEAIG